MGLELVYLGVFVMGTVGQSIGATMWSGNEDTQRAPLRTCSVPVVPTLAARISPQYLSLHQEMHQPPSASRCEPGPVLVSDCCICDEWTGSGGVVSREGNAWVGVASAAVLEGGPWMDGRGSMSISSVSCHVVRTGCSRHS